MFGGQGGASLQGVQAGFASPTTPCYKGVMVVCTHRWKLSVVLGVRSCGPVPCWEGAVCSTACVLCRNLVWSTIQRKEAQVWCLTP